MGRSKIYTTFWLKNPKGRYYLVKLFVDEIVIIKRDPNENVFQCAGWIHLAL
jgi:hypothetical protein